MPDINFHIARLVAYAVKNGLVSRADKTWTVNMMLSVLRLDSFEEPSIVDYNLPKYPSGILSEISKWAAANGLIENLPVSREILEGELCGIITPRPFQFTAKFEEIEKRSGIKKAAAWMYKTQQQCDYIKIERAEKNLAWKTDTKYGKLDITVNLSKPEKTPEEIAAVKKLGAAALSRNIYPKCMLCRENEGYRGRLNYPARQNIRLIPLKLNGEKWFFQYSPYIYYNEHCIVLNGCHTDMAINKDTFVRLADFLERFPHYFIGSNADLPVVGGSILNHDHYQGGRYTFPMHKVKTRKTFKIKNLPDIECEILDWPLSVLRFSGSRRGVLKAANIAFDAWVNYNDPAVAIRAYDGQTRHNTVTPMARIAKGKLQLDIALRNNAASEEFPEGIFHSHKQFHHIKRENIGLIEVMGLAILPGRLKSEFEELSDCLVKNDFEKIKNSLAISKHYDWALKLADRYKFTPENAEEILRKETGTIFAEVLECCGVFKKTLCGAAALDRFLKTLS
ncbi:MAG: UDP-glucose--hexose-1-phosphate uridylyltransferase [Elusimicrobiota bacterium]|jgi:UDPglucose--hexose-1-phosphate uridylyltransferase|nr:UDP-glucose--hexose-1-phosphate uridylyltransferase [Elusimicrobiota bacterium]